jgi:S1-C subfamily serine protease
MIVRWLAVAVLLGWASTARAADWWWVGYSGTAPSRVVSYVDRESIHQADGGVTEVWTLAVGETPLPSGQQHQANHFGFKCRQRAMSQLGRIPLNAAWQRVPLMEIPPAPYAPVGHGSIGETIMNLVCGHPSGNELHVDQPAQHALVYLRNLNGAAAATPGPAPAPAPEQAPAPQQAEEAGPSLGTGFFVDPAGHLITSYHVIAGAERIGCRTADGNVHEATVARASQMNDLALLQVNFRPAHYLSLAARGALHAGDRVFTVGYGAPNYLGVNEPRFTEGSISALSGPNADDAWMQITVPIQPGNSGGPVVNETGQVVGIIAATAATEDFLQAEGQLPQNVNWAVKADYAAPLLPPQPPAAPRTRAQAIALTQDSVCLIIALPGGDQGR